jgi:hypothetical protein
MCHTRSCLSSSISRDGAFPCVACAAWWLASTKVEAVSYEMDNETAEYGSGEYGSGGVACAEDGPPPLLVDPGTLMLYAFYGSCVVILLMFIHYIQPLAKEATRVSKVEPASDRATTFEATLVHRTVKFTTSKWQWMRYMDWPWLEAEFEGEAFYNFVITLILEAVLNATNTANTHLEGDLEFSNDPTRSIIIVSWLLSGMEAISIFILVSERRRSKGKSCWCLKPHDYDEPEAGRRGRRFTLMKAKHRRGIVQLVTWFTLIHDAFQITIASVATASQVASAGSPRSAMFINAIEVSAIVFVKLFNLYTWADTWKQQNGLATFKRRKMQLAALVQVPVSAAAAAAAMVSSDRQLR